MGAVVVGLAVILDASSMRCLGFKGFAEGVVWVEGLIRYDEGAGASPVPLGGSPPRGDRRGVGWSVCGG